MGWHLDREDKGGPIEIEPAPEPRPRSLPAWSNVSRSIGLVVLGVVAGVLVTLTVTRDDPKAGPAITTTTTARPLPMPTIGAVVATSPSTTPSPPASPVLPFGHETGIVLYLAPDGGAPDRLVAYDVDR